MHDRLIQTIALVLLCGGIVGAFLLTPSINRERVDRQLTYDIEVGDNANPMYTLGASLGSFRGVMVNILWQRAEELKREGKFFEANNLAEMITTLQPRYPEAWNFHGWNMAYNISVKCKTAEERWDWVQKGMALIRDRGIPNNPNAVVLYRSLAWTLGHKMAGQTDDMQWYYKERWVEKWHTLLGEPVGGADFKPEFTGDNRPTQEEFDPLVHIDWRVTQRMQKIADMANTYLRRPGRPKDDYNASNYFKTLSPDAKAKFFANYPHLLPIVREIEAIQGADGQELDLGLNSKFLRAIGRIKMYEDAGYWVNNPQVISPETVGVEGVAVKQWMDTRSAKQWFNHRPMVNLEAMRASAQAQDPDIEVIDLMPLLDLLRAQALIADYNMDPAFMVKTMERFGPIEWRHPAAHAMYWSALGTLRAEQWEKDKDRVDFINANRNTIHNIQNLAHEGKIAYRPRVEALGAWGQPRIHFAADTRMIPAYERAVTETREMIERGDFGDKHKNIDTYNRGHENFLQTAVVLYYLEGQEALARKYHDKVRDEYGDDPSSTVASEGDYKLQIGDFVRARIEDDLGYQNEEMITFYIRQAWRKGVTTRDPTVMKRYLAQGKAVYQEYLSDRQTSIRNDADVQGRQDLAPFGDFVLIYFLEVMADPSYTLAQKAAVWRQGAPMFVGLESEQPLLMIAYQQMGAPLTQQAQVEGWDENWFSLFPEPRGYREWASQAGQPQPGPRGPIRPNP